MELVKPTIELEEKYLDFISEWQESGERIVPGSVDPHDMDYPSWLEYDAKFEKRETCPTKYVPSNTYFLIDNNKIIGATNIRHLLNESLINIGGHIGYGVRPSERRKGYASKMLALALPIAKNLGINKVLITCDKDNIGSAKTIMNNGGVLENEVTEDGKIAQRYWINLVNA